MFLDKLVFDCLGNSYALIGIQTEQALHKVFSLCTQLNFWWKF